ncbi:MAG: Flp pilus assembly complex ATPase component TadA, partial [Phycisphaerae bacterium]|nr:Flp pilus assembly complex ATPase component TadA [Phycisphaerae bacterium]
MARARQRRQHERHAIDLGAQLSILDESASQVAPLIGHQIETRLANLSQGGARAIVRTYLPRGTLVDVHLPASGGLAPQALRAQVVSTEMTDQTPRYALGLRWQVEPGALVDELAQGEPSAAPAPAPSTRSPSVELPPDRPKWMELLLQDGIATRAVLDQGWEKVNGDEEAIADWLVSEGHVTQGDISLAQATACELPYVEVGNYRVDNANQKLVREEMARAHSVFPAFVLEHIITVAVARPLDLAVLDQIRLQTGCEVDQCLTPPRELQQLINWAYGGFDESAEATPSEKPGWLDGLDEVADAPAVKLVDVLLDRAVSSRASDIHIDAEENRLRVRFRVDGVLREVPAPPKSMLPAIVSRIKILSRLNIAETRRPQDGHFKLAAEQEEMDIRVSTLPSASGEAVVLRLLRSGARLLTLEELGMAHECLAQFERLIHLPHGMLLVTGPTGSGKTTTLYSGLTRLDRVRQSIITLEDPVEVRLPQVRQVSVNPKAGLTFE